MESVVLALIKLSHSVSVAPSCNDLLEEAVRSTCIPLKFVVSDVTSTSLFNAEHSFPADYKGGFVNSLLNDGLGHLAGASEDLNGSLRLVVNDGPRTCTNRVNYSNSSMDETLQGDGVRRFQES